MSLYFIILLIIITVAYNTYAIIINKGIPESLSSTSYVFLENNKKYYYFSIYCILTAAILLPIWLNASIEEWKFLVFLTCYEIIFAGVTPFFREDFHKSIHYTAGILAVITYILWMILSGYTKFLMWEGIITLIPIIFNYKNFVYYIEVFGLLTLLILLIILSTTAH